MLHVKLPSTGRLRRCLIIVAVALTLTSTKNPGTVFGVGTTVVTYTATDAVGNTSTCSFNVLVRDVTSPVISGCPSNITVNANASCQATVSWTVPTVSENCGGGLTLTTTKNPGTVFGLGTTVVTYTATDAAGNSSTCSFNVIVQDNSNPVISGMSFEHYRKCERLLSGYCQLDAANRV